MVVENNVQLQQPFLVITIAKNVLFKKKPKKSNSKTEEFLFVHFTYLFVFLHIFTTSYQFMWNILLVRVRGVQPGTMCR